MSNIVDTVEFEQDFEGMLRRALERIIQLYTDKSHFVYELLQNAEDAGAKSIKFVQYLDRLEVFHDGKPFTMQNLRSLCDIGLSDKTDDYNQIGEFGVGFKSVFGICETVQLYSEPSNYRGGHLEGALRFAKEIVDFVKHRNIPFEQLPPAYTTRFVFPYSVGKSFSGYSELEELKTVLSSKLQDLGITTLLFMKNLESIEYRVETDENVVEGQYLIDKQKINDHCLLASALGVSNVKGNEESGENLVHYLKFSRPIDNISARTVDIAFPVKVAENGTYECLKPRDPYISVYFPTETESKLGFIVQGPYRTTPNRSSIPANDKDNIHLARETAMLLKSALLELRDSGKLNMSFVKALPLNSRAFDNFNLFYPLYEVVKSLFVSDRIIPTHYGEYASARESKIPRPERLVTLFSDDLLTALHSDGAKYKWLSPLLTETNSEYEHVYKYLTNELKITIIRPENLRLYFDKNPRFLSQRTEDWLVELYSVYENVPAAFAKNKNDANTLTCCIIKTTTGNFVAPYRKLDNKQLIPNVFLYTAGIDDPDIHFVSPSLYERCKDFFDIVLQIKKPNEYEFFIEDIKRRYNENYVFEEEKHIDDIKKIIRYYRHEEYREEVVKLIRENILVRCNDGFLNSPYMTRIYLSVNADGIEIENYLRNIAQGISFVDSEFYLAHGIDIDSLSILGIRKSILINEGITSGQYLTGRPGKQPDWWTPGDLRWKLSVEYIKDALRYISKHPTAKDSVSKSITIFHLLLQNESKLVGRWCVGGSNIPNKENETCDLIKILRRETLFDWDGKWLYTVGGELVSPDMVSRHEISSKYFKSKTDTVVCELLGFKKTEKDELEALKKTIPSDKLEALIDYELRKRFGLGLEEIGTVGGSVIGTTEDGLKRGDTEEVYPFPVARVKNWDTLRKHAAEMLCYADPVKYDYAVRRIRVSNRPKEARAYLLNMYRYDGVYKYACQMCHDSCASVEIAELFNKPETELDPLNLCLCPNCATRYRTFRNNSRAMESFLESIMAVKERDMGEEYVSVSVENVDIWFTHIHFAEIQELLKLSEEAKNVDRNKTSPVGEEDANEESGVSVYSSLVGKRLKRKDGFEAEITVVEDDYIKCKILSGVKSGQETKIQLSFVLSNPNVYQVL